MNVLTTSSLALLFLCLGLGTTAPAHNNDATIDPIVRPILVMHGLVSSSYTLERLRDRIVAAHPKASVLMIDIYTYMSSFEACQTQTNALIDVVRELSQNATQGVTLVCYSQGAILCRALLEQMDDHPVHTFISLAGPLAGQFGVSRFLVGWYWWGSKYDVYDYAYKGISQRVSIFNYWKDPLHFREYLEGNTFLPYIENEKKHSRMGVYKRNFLRTERIVLIGGEDDEVIEPWQSSLLGFHQRGSDKIVLDVRKTPAYLNNTYGLRSLDERGGLIIHSIPGVTHLRWHQEEIVFLQAVLPYL